MSYPRLTGLIAAPFTPFLPNGEVNYELISRQAESLIADGITGAYVCGTTGEGILCTLEERMKIVEAWKEAAQGKLKLIIHVGAYALKDAAVLARHAVEVKADGFSVIPHGFFRHGFIANLVEYCRNAAALAPELPFYYYNTMSAGLTFPMATFLKQASEAIPNLGGIKYYSYDLFEYQKCLAFQEGKYDVVYGADELFTAALACGAKGFIGSTYNYMPGLYQSARAAFEKGDMAAAQAQMKKVHDIVDILGEFGGIATGKVLMQLKGLDCGDVRAPLAPLSAQAKQIILDRARAILAK